MHIKVLQHHIDEGQRRSAWYCAVALAVREQVPNSESVSVGAAVQIDGKHYSMPNEAKSFIACFDRECPDRYGHVKPFEFDIEEILCL